MTDRERAEQLHREGHGYKAIAHRLGVSRDQVRGWLRPRPRCPRCGEPMSQGAKLCRRCAPTAGRKPAADRLDAPLATHVPRAEAAAFAELVGSQGSTISADLRAYVRRRLAEAEGPGAGMEGRLER